MGKCAPRSERMQRYQPQAIKRSSLSSRSWQWLGLRASVSTATRQTANWGMHEKAPSTRNGGFPKTFFEKLANRRDITVTIQFTYAHKNYEMTITPDQTIDTSCDYYGPLKLIELYGASEVAK